MRIFRMWLGLRCMVLIPMSSLAICDIKVHGFASGYFSLSSTNLAAKAALCLSLSCWTWVLINLSSIFLPLFFCFCYLFCYFC